MSDRTKISDSTSTSGKQQGNNVNFASVMNGVDQLPGNSGESTASAYLPSGFGIDDAGALANGMSGRRSQNHSGDGGRQSGSAQSSEGRANFGKRKNNPNELDVEHTLNKFAQAAQQSQAYWNSSSDDSQNESGSGMQHNRHQSLARAHADDSGAQQPLTDGMTALHGGEHSQVSNFVGDNAMQNSSESPGATNMQVGEGVPVPEADAPATQGEAINPNSNNNNNDNVLQQNDYSTWTNNGQTPASLFAPAANSSGAQPTTTTGTEDTPGQALPSPLTASGSGTSSSTNAGGSTMSSAQSSALGELNPLQIAQEGLTDASQALQLAMQNSGNPQTEQLNLQLAQTGLSIANMALNLYGLEGTNGAGTTGGSENGLTGNSSSLGNGDGTSCAGTTTSSGNGNEGTTTASASEGSTTATSAGEANSNAGSTTASNPILAAMEQSDPTLATALTAASSQLTASGNSELDNYLEANNQNANPNLDATLMSNALTQAGLSTTDASALQNIEKQSMPMAQVLTFAQQNDPALYQTLTDASTQLSSPGWNQVENYLVNNYTADNSMDSTLMSNVLTQAGLSPSDQNALTSVLQQDMPTALAADPFAAGLQATDPTMSQTLTDAANQLSGSGYQQLQQYVEDNYTGVTSSDPTIMSNALTEAGLSASDQSALTNVLQQDMPAALNTSYNPANDAALQNLSNTGDSQLQQTLLSAWSDVQNGQLSQSAYSQFENTAIPLTTPANDPGGVPFSSDTPLEQAALNSIQPNISAGDAGTLQGLINAQSGDSGAGNTGSIGTNGTNGDGAPTGTTTGTSGNTGETGANGTSGDGGNNNSTTTFNVGGTTLLEPPQSSSGLVTPLGSESGDATAYQGTIQGTTSGANNVTPDAETTGQGNGPDALQLTPESLLTSMDTTTGQGFQQKYGYFEADIKVGQTSSGAVDPNNWPGWFLESSAYTLKPGSMNSSGTAYQGNPSAEIDIMEAQTSSSNGQGDTAYNAGVHQNSAPNLPSGYDQDAGPYTTGLPSISSGYNTYGVNWQPNDPNIEFYFDGQEVGYNKAYDDTADSPMYLVLDDGNGGWNTTDPSASGGNIDVAWVRAYQNANLVNSTNDPDGTVGSTITDTNPDDSPPALTNVSAGGGNTPVTWVNTFNTDFSQASDYTTNGANTTALLNPNSGDNNPNVPSSGNLSTYVTGAQDTPWYEAQWMVDQSTSALGVASGVSTTPGANG